MLRYEFDSTVMARLARPVFDRIANTLVDAFVARADRVHAGGGALAPAATIGRAAVDATRRGSRRDADATNGGRRRAGARPAAATIPSTRSPPT